MKVKLGGVCAPAIGLTVVLLASTSVGALRPTHPSAASPVQPPASAQSGASSAASTQRALVDKYCVTCHNARVKTAGLMLDKMDLDRVPDGAPVWEKVVRKLRGGMMPPPGAPRPDEAGIDALVSFLETTIDRDALAQANPGRSPLHRLNRSEYANAIRDLLALDVDATALLPADDEANGFDNIADVLKVSPSLVEQYLTASRKIATLAVGDPHIVPVSSVYRVPPDRPQADHVEGLPLGTRGGLVIHHSFPLDADYDFRVNLLQNIVGYVPGLEWPHLLEIAIDGERVFTASVGGEEDNKLSDTNLALAKETLDARLRARIHVKAGPRIVTVAFIRKNSAESVEPLQPFTRDLDMQNMNGIPLIEHVQIGGPFNATGPGDTPSRRRIFICRPTSPEALPRASTHEETDCAKTILSTLARRAYRRPVDTEIDTLLAFYESGRKTGTFDNGIESAVRFILTSPKFIFRDEPDPANLTAGTVYPVSDLELASRLSFFLWSSVPDDQLLAAATQGRLKEPAVIERQVRRMLADPKSSALVDNFAAQWLFLRNLQSFLPDTATFPNFDDSLRQGFRKETGLFFESIMREDRSVLDLLTADYTFVNERLARHYGIPDVYGSRFRRVTVTDENRRGLLGQGSVLSVTSYPNRTSPVLRGKWILENILGTPPPAPPPNVPTLRENGEDGRVMSVRARLEEHRKNPACATCHRVMDPLGFSLENFDATGAWRTKEARGVDVDASGQLADGTPVDGPVALREALVRRPEQFVRTMTEKLLTYSLGRGLEYYDMPVVRAIVRNAARQDYRFSSLVTGIVKSTPFQMKKSQGGDTQVTASRSSNE
jgi:mono/diheme cytochrome c family protein